MAATPVGPVFVGGFEEFVVNDESGEQYTILYLPDRNNDKLQQEGKPPHYYWVPGSVRLARFGDVGDYKFRHIHFVGAFDPNLHVGVEGRSEVVGGLLSFTTTYRYPTAVLRQAEQQLLDKFRGNSDRYWGWRTQAAPMFSVIPIRSANTVVTNLSPGRNGTAPVENIPTGGSSAGNSGNPAVPSDNGAPVPENNGSSAPKSLVRRAKLDQKVIHGRGPNISNLDAWAFELQGQGPSSTTGGETAFSGLVGALPSELIWAGMQGGASPIAVTQFLTLPVWSQEIYLKITGNWDRIFQHFSAHANAQKLWFSGDIKAEFNQLRINGGITVEMAVDGTLPGADKLEEEINKRIDVITKVFTDEASKRIFEPPPPNVTPAEAPSGGFLSRFFGGGGFALKYRRDETKLNLHYEETRYIRYLQPTVISSSFEGFYNLLKNDKDVLKKYFIRLIMGDLSLKVARIVKPVVNWPDPAKNWVGEPVSFLSAEISYPGSNGSMQWNMKVFQRTDTTDQSNWNPVFVKRGEDEVQNPPSGWKPDVTYIRRRVHLTEPMGMTDNPFVKVQVERNVIDLDPMGGTPMTDNVIEVRADSVGLLECGPIDIDAVLEDNTQVVTVEFLAEGKRHDGGERPAVKFQWRSSDIDQPRFWEIFTGQSDYIPRYKYRVSVNVKGSLFSAGMAWTGPWVDGQGNGPLMVHVPRQDEPGVTTRRLAPREVALNFSDGQDNSGGIVVAPTGETPSGATPEVPLPPGNGQTPKVEAPPTEKTITNDSAERVVSGYGISDLQKKALSDEIKAPPGGFQVNPPDANSSNSKKTAGEQEELKLLTGDQAWIQL